MGTKERVVEYFKDRFPSSERQEKKARVIEIYDGRCANFDHCKNPERPTIHHILFRRDTKNSRTLANFPIDEISNYIPLCPDCHHELHEKIDIQEGYSSGISKKERCFYLKKQRKEKRKNKQRWYRF